MKEELQSLRDALIDDIKIMLEEQLLNKMKTMIKEEIADEKYSLLKIVEDIMKLKSNIDKAVGFMNTIFELIIL